MKSSDIIRPEYYDNVVITSENELLKQTKRIEKIFRSSNEYKKYIHSIKEGLVIDNCAFFNDKDFENCTLELHHILTLYNIVNLVGTKLISKLKEDEFLTVYDIVNGVIEFHMKDYPVIMMLSKTIHELHHSGQYTLPKDSETLHIGDRDGFLREYAKEIKKLGLKEVIEDIYKYFETKEENNEQTDEGIKVWIKD